MFLTLFVGTLVCLFLHGACLKLYSVSLLPFIPNFALLLGRFSGFSLLASSGLVGHCSRHSVLYVVLFLLYYDLFSLHFVFAFTNVILRHEVLFAEIILTLDEA